MPTASTSSLLFLQMASSTASLISSSVPLWIWVFGFFAGLLVILLFIGAFKAAFKKIKH